jgi:phosphotransferase system  glucose/maltose/N-acetylglucosamine-specific IIC component
LAYTVIVTLADPNGATGENSFDLILSAAGGTLTTTDPNAEINSATEASASDSVSPMSASQWTVQWTAPTSGTVTIDVWAVMDQTGATGIKAKYDLRTSTLTAGPAIPEFPALLIPVVGIGLAVVVAAKATRKSE